MGILNKIKNQADHRIVGSKANSFRKKRVERFEAFIHENCSEKLNGGADKVRIIDLGGTYDYWANAGFSMTDKVEITLVNLEDTYIPEGVNNFISITGDATKLEDIKDKTYDIAFSNSCIEHVGKEREWKMMAREMERVAEHVYLQTPNRYFPIEPHFMFPFFQFFPLKLKAYLILHHQLGFWPQGCDWDDSLRLADSIKLLSLRDLKRLFPKGKIWKEKLYGLTKSFTIYY